MTPPRRWLVPAVAIVLLALSLRLAVSAVGVVLDPIRLDLDLGAGSAGLLTTLPVLAFAVFGLATGAVVRRLGVDHTAAFSLVLLTVAMVARVAVDSGVAFIAVSAVALGAAAVGNVVLPPLARRHLPDHVGTISGIYGAAIVGGAALSAALTVPIADATGSWRPALGWWAVVPAVAVVPWLLVLRSPRSDAHSGDAAPAEARPRLLRSRTTWVITIFFGVQSIVAYVQFGWFATMLTEQGVDEQLAGSMLALLAAVGIPLSLSLPILRRRLGDGAALPWLFGLTNTVGWSGMWLTDAAVPWLWAILLGVGSGAFPWVLSMIPDRSRTVSGTAALSSTTQGLGYALAAIGPFGVGLLRDATGSFDIALALLAATGIVLGVLGTMISRAGFVEDELRP